MLYVNMEDERLADFKAEDFNRLLEAHGEMYGGRPMLFIDEIQNIEHWEKFARRMADTGYKVMITGSNSKMLSGEIASTLGGRYIAHEIYPYSLKEYLDANGVESDERALLGTETRAAIVRHASAYLHGGGLPAAARMSAKRDYLNSVYQKMYIGDIMQRNGLTNSMGMRVLVRKMAESVCRPISYNRLTNIMSSVGGKMSTATTIKYVEHCEDAWLLIRLRNIVAHLAEKESNCKYYFVDNGILNLFMTDSDSMLLENVVALWLFRKYGHDSEKVFFYNDGSNEVDFYLPEEETAIQVSMTLRDEETRRREIGALEKIGRRMPCRRRIVVTGEETEEREVVGKDGNGIEIVVYWRFIMG